MTMPEVHLFLPQMRMSMDAIVERAQAAEAAGFGGIAFMDHLFPPLAPEQPMTDAMTTAAWVLAQTTTLRVGHLVLCDAFHNPVVLAKQAVTLDQASGGRFDLGIGWGSQPQEFPIFGVGSTEAKVRVDRFSESLEVMRLLWTGEQVSYDGRHHTLAGAMVRPMPLDRIPILIGGVGKRTVGLVAQHADWWNVPVSHLHRLEARRDAAGDARVSIQYMLAYAPPDADLDDVVATADHRWPQMRAMGALASGRGPAMVEHLQAMGERGVERVYAWFTDFARPATLEAFGAEVLAGG